MFCQKNYIFCQAFSNLLLLPGGFGGMCTVVVGHPFDTIKVNWSFWYYKGKLIVIIEIKMIWAPSSVVSNHPKGRRHWFWPLTSIETLKDSNMASYLFFSWPVLEKFNFERESIQRHRDKSEQALNNGVSIFFFFRRSRKLKCLLFLCKCTVHYAY